MRLLVAALMLASACGWAHADLEGSTVHLIEPIYGVEADQTYTFVFQVVRDMSSTEILTEVLIMFYPSSLTVYGHTMGFDEIEPGRPSFELINVSGAVHWRETDDAAGIRAGESTLLWVDVRTAPDTPPWSKGLIGWGVQGAAGGSNNGFFYFYTPVEPGTWGAIKALYR